VASVGVGTAGHATTVAEQLPDASTDQLWPMCHPVPGKYAWLGCTLTGGASLTWLRDVFGRSFEELIAEAEPIPPGSEGLFFMPWLEGMSIPYPDSHARGGFVGLTLRHTPGHMVRALMEGVVFDLRHCLESFESIGLPVDYIRMGEGGSRASLWGQIQADVFGRNLRVVETKDFSAVGAALIAAVGSGLFPDFETACAATVRLGETIYAGPERVAVYDSAFQRYAGLYPSLKAWFTHGR
jgi:xylulokinase